MLRRYLMRRSKASHAFGYKRRLLIRAYFPVHACMHVGIYELVCLLVHVSSCAKWHGLSPLQL
jgi:hypothetical protein